MNEYTDYELLNTAIAPREYEDADPVISTKKHVWEDIVVEMGRYRGEPINWVHKRGFEWRGQYLDTLPEMQTHIDRAIANL